MPNWCSTAYAIEGNATELKDPQIHFAQETRNRIISKRQRC